MKIILHCSDSGFGNAALLTKWHIVERRWSTIGYHYVILNGQLLSTAFNKFHDGSIETGRPIDDDDKFEGFEYGAHTKGQNTQSIGICLIGKSGDFTVKQLNSLEYLLAILRNQFGSIEVFQHSDFEPNKPHCAGLSKEYLDKLNKRE